MANEESDPGSFPKPCPESGSIFFNGISVEGWILQEGKSGEGFFMRGCGDFSRENIDNQARLSFS